MARAKHKVETFSLSFLDIMSCGFGAIILLFLISKHLSDAVPVRVNENLRASEVTLLDEEITEGRKNLAKIRNTISDVDDELAAAKGLASRIMEEKKETAAMTETVNPAANAYELEAVKAQIKVIERRNEELKQEINKTGEDARRVAGEGKQQYLTGLKVQGSHILILLDMSASMLDNSIVNVVRFRNMRDELKRNAQKWRRTIRIVEWLTATMPLDSKYQILAFNTDVRPVLPESNGQWLDVRDSVHLRDAVADLRLIVPENGTNLERAFASVGRMQPLPDSVYLITDGLPTQDASPPRSTTISSKDRLGLFSKAVKAIPKHVPISIILAPMEGDPEAGPAFWGLARATGGTFMSPSGDWP